MDHPFFMHEIVEATVRAMAKQRGHEVPGPETMRQLTDRCSEKVLGVVSAEIVATLPWTANADGT